MPALLSSGLEFTDSSVQTTAVQSGFIIMWYGDINNIPVGWKLCNGLAGTPDLRNRFVVGAGAGYGVGATGGLDTVTLTVANLPWHQHPVSNQGTSANGQHGKYRGRRFGC